METFRLASHLREVYATYPEATHRPVVGITANYTDGDATLRDRYYAQVVRAGGVPLIIPPVADKEVIVNTLDHIDALLLTGGGDHNPLWMAQQPSPLLHGINATRDLPELLITQLAFNRQIPMLGICRGLQTLAITLGGSVAQDISLLNTADSAAAPQADAPAVKHSQDADRSLPTHTVTLLPHSVLASLYATDGEEPKTLCVNSFHHQAVSHTGPRFKAVAWAADGVVEAMESTEMKPVMGVQWHPEWLGDDGLPLFRWLVEQAALFWQAKRLHERFLTLDTHCDTPMFFPQGVQFGRRDNRILYDLHKMTDGRQDAVIMAAYLPQPKMGQRFSETVDIAGIISHNPNLASLGTQLSPAQYADLIFDKLESIVADKADYISIARTPADLYEDKRQGRRSIMFGIENGLALNHDLAYVRHFAQRGVVYITLCHNGDNDICDSARGCSTHGGVSAFGEKVILCMNDEGIMVDLSHAAEQSFYDALDISRTPIVCSHSNARALCDVPRNLTDDQMRALAKKGGVAHITLYHGFLQKDTPEATILDAINHLEHAIQVMGIDHVGIGTDFDGDGTVRGCADASELINFTRHLLLRRYSERDIAKIWGGNWLRVMAQVQSVKGDSNNNP